MKNDLDTVLGHLTDEQLLDAFESKTAGYSPDAHAAMKKMLLERGFHAEHIDRMEHERTDDSIPQRKGNLDGIGGWLIFWGINLFFMGLGAVIGGAVIISEYPVFGSLIIIYGAVFLLAFIWYSKRHRLFPRFMIIALSIGSVLALYGAIVGELADPSSSYPAVNANMFTIAYNLLWIAYFVRSRRVKATFLS